MDEELDFINRRLEELYADYKKSHRRLLIAGVFTIVYCLLAGGFLISMAFIVSNKINTILDSFASGFMLMFAVKIITELIKAVKDDKDIGVVHCRIKNKKEELDTIVHDIPARPRHRQATKSARGNSIN